jgi:hypothetical protein
MGPDDAVRLCIADCTIAAVPGKPWRGAGQDSQNPERHIRMAAAARVHLQAFAQSLEQPKWWTIRNRGHVADAQTFHRIDLHLGANSPAHSTQNGPPHPYPWMRRPAGLAGMDTLEPSTNAYVGK